MEKEIMIRELTHDDVLKYEKELIRYMHMVLEENTPNIDYDYYAQKYYNNMKDFTLDGSAILIGGFDGDVLVGFHWGYEVMYLGEKRVHSYFSAIEYDYRGKHLGSKFFDELGRITKERGIDTIEAMCSADNEIAVNYHLKNGFKIDRYKVIKRL